MSVVGIVLVAVSGSAEAQEPLSAKEINAQIVGHRFQGKKGILSVSLNYAADGTATLRTPLGTGRGRWTLSDNRLCVRLETGPRKENECLSFTSQPDGSYQVSNGMRLVPVE